MDALCVPTALVNFLGHLTGALDENSNDIAGVLETAGRLHVGDSVALDLDIGRLLLEDVDKLEVCRVGADAVDDGEGKLSLGEILTHALVVAVLLGRQVHVVVTDLEDESNEVDEGHTVSRHRRFGSHELDTEAEQASRLVAHHLEVVLLSGAGEGVAPEQVHALPPVEVYELLGKDGDEVRVVEAVQLLQGDKVDVVCRVDGLRDAKDVVRHGEPAAQLRRVLDVVDEQRRLVEHAHDARDDLEALLGYV